MSYWEDNILEVKPDFELEAIREILYGTTEWSEYGPENPGNEELVNPWKQIRYAPKFNGSEWVRSYHVANYVEFFENTIYAGTANPLRQGSKPVAKLNFLGPVTKDYEGSKIPEHLLAIAEINAHTGENVELRKEKLVNLWKTADSERKRFEAGELSTIATVGRDYIKAVFELYGEIIGVPYDILPTGFDGQLITNQDLSWSQRYSSWTKPVSYEFEDFRDILLYLYLNEQNDRRERLQQIAAEDEAADNVEIPDDGSAMSELKNAANAERARKMKNGEDLTVFDRLALDALTGGDDDFFANTLRESTQCILRLNLDSYVSANEDEEGTYAQHPRYHESVYLDRGPAASAMNKLAYCPSSREFLDITPQNASNLVPMVRLFKTYYNKETNLIDREVEVAFDGHTNSSAWKDLNPLVPKQGVGIKSVDWSLNATNPATVRNDIEFNIVLYFQNFGDLLVLRNGRDIITGEKQNYKYEDLLLRPPTDSEKDIPESGEETAKACERKRTDKEIYDPRFYEIKALVGWAPPENIDANPAIKESVKNQQLPMFLTLIDHEFSFTQEGTFELSIKYRARLESLGNDPRLDVLSNAKTKARVKELEKEIKSLQKTCGAEKTIEYYRGEVIRVQEKDRDNLAQTIIDGLKDRIYLSSLNRRELMAAIVGDVETDKAKMISNLKISEKAVRDSIKNKLGSYKDEVLEDYKKRNIDTFSKNHPTAKKKEEEATNSGTTEEKEKSPLASGFLQDSENAKNIVIPWFYFGDLVNVVVSHALPKSDEVSTDDTSSIHSTEVKNLVYLFGSFQYNLTSPLTLNSTYGKTAFLTSVPVSLELFNQWFAKRVLEPDRSTYPILQFLRDFMADVVVPSLNKTCFDSPEFRLQWASGANRTLFRKEYKKPNETLEEFTYRGWGRKPLSDAKGYYYRVDASDPNDDRGPYLWCEVPKVILKTAAISLPSDVSAEPGDQSQNTLGGNPLERLHLASHAGDFGTKYRGKYPFGWIDTSQWSPDMVRGKTITRRENSYDQTLKNSYHINVFYVISSDNYKIFGPWGTWEDPRPMVPEFRESLPSRQDRDFSYHGVFHLFLGADRGLVKSVNFSKVDAPYLREARIQQDSLNPLALLAATYNVTLKLIGNTIFWPGQYIFVNPIGFGSGIGHPGNVYSPSNQLGLGGYHLVTRVKCFIEDGKFETEVKALFEFSGDGCSPLPNKTAPGCDGNVGSSTATDVKTPGYKPGT